MLNSSDVDVKDQTIELRRNQILEGAASVFVKKGFHKATTKEIARAAGVAEGTIYNYFENKRELLVAMVDLVAMQSLKQIVLRPDDPRKLLTAVMQDRFQLTQDWGSLLAPIMAEIFSDVELRQALYQQVVIPVSAHLEQFVQAQIDSGRFHQIDPVIVTRSLMGALLINFALKLTGLDERYKNFTNDSMIEQLTTLFLDGLISTEP